MKNAGYRAPAVSRAFDVLKTIAGSRSDLGISELARQLDLSKSTTHGLVRTLLDIGALEQNLRSKKLCLGPVIVELAFHSWNYLHIREQAQPELNRIRDQIGETVFLGLLSQDKATIIATAEAVKPLKISSPPGTSIPLLSGAVGKVALAQRSEAEAAVYLNTHPLPRFTRNTIVRPEKYLKELKSVRRKGYALDDEEYLPGVKAVAATLGNQRGLPLAIWVVGFTTSLSDGRLNEVVGQTISGARALCKQLDAKNRAPLVF